MCPSSLQTDSALTVGRWMGYSLIYLVINVRLKNVAYTSSHKDGE